MAFDADVHDVSTSPPTWRTTHQHSRSHTRSLGVVLKSLAASIACTHDLGTLCLPDMELTRRIGGCVCLYRRSTMCVVLTISLYLASECNYLHVFFLVSLCTFTEGEDHLPAAGAAGGENPQHRGVLDQYTGAPEALRRQLPHHLDWTVRDRLHRLLLSLLSADLVAAHRVHHAAADVSDCVSCVPAVGNLDAIINVRTIWFAELFCSSVCSPGTTSEN